VCARCLPPGCWTLTAQVRSRAGPGWFFSFSAGLGLLVIAPGAVVTGTLVENVTEGGGVAAGLPAAIRSKGAAVSITAQVHPYPGITAGEAAVRRAEVDVLVADAQRLEWTTCRMPPLCRR
jgi:hypothetical protein